MTFKANDACTNDSVTRTFKVTKADAVTVEGPASIDQAVCDFTDQAGLTLAYDAWVAKFKITNAGCNGKGGFETAPPARVDFCAGADITLTFKANDACTNDSVSSTFKVTAAAAVDVTGPANVSKTSCDYADQAALDAAFSAWLADFKTVNPGCNATAVMNPTSPVAPTLCSGGSVTVSYSIEDNCTKDSVSATFSITKADAVDVTGPANVSKTSCDYAVQADVDTAFAAWLADFKTVNPGCNATAVMSPVSPQAPILCEGGSITVSYSIEDNCTKDSVSATFSIEAAAKLNVSCLGDIVVKCDQNKEELFAQWIAGFTHTGGCPDAVVTDLTKYSLPAAGVPLVIEYVVTDNCQTDSCKATFTVDFCEALCTYTQGYYGNVGGKSCSQGVSYTTTGLIAKGLASYPLGKMVIGLPGKSVSMSNNTTDIAKIIDVLPGGGSSSVLLAGDYPITSMPSSYLKKGTINNTLLAQTMTLGLNLGIDSALGKFALKAGKLATAAPLGGCGSKIPTPRSCSYDVYTPTINEYKYFDIPAVVNLLPNKTVKGLFDMANKALGGGTLPAGVTLLNLANAVDVINNAFDGCRISMGYDQTPLTCVEDRAAFDVSPVPSLVEATVTYKFSYVSNVTIEVWNISGVKLYSQPDTNSSFDKKVIINYPFGTSGTYIIKLNTNIGSSSRTVIKN